MHSSHSAEKKMKENVLNMEYHGNSLETSSRCVLSIFEEKKNQFFPLKGKN